MSKQFLILCNHYRLPSDVAADGTEKFSMLYNGDYSHRRYTESTANAVVKSMNANYFKDGSHYFKVEIPEPKEA